VRIGELLQLTLSSVSEPTTEFDGADGRVYEAALRRIDAHTCSIDFLDVTERVESGRRLHAQARQDHLTGLPNRRALVEAIEERLGDPARPSGSLLLIDLDEFKEINDALGHETGDRLLCSIGARIVNCVGDGGLVGRLGGDEFAVLLRTAEGPASVRVAEKIAEVVNAPVVLGDLRLRVRASIGVADHPSDADAVTELLRCADVAMYRAKRRSTSVERYDRRRDGADTGHLALVADLEQAIADGQLLLHHQPLIETATGAVVGTEVLTRWQHPTRGLLAPDLFIELAEMSGQMKQLTRWVIRRALQDLVDLGEAGRDLEVSVNLSVRNLYEDDLVDWLAGQLTSSGIDPARLVVEITESTAMDDQGTAVEVIGRLRSLGVRTWIDDFGTGHSSFARLRDIPAHGVKIDRAFVAAAATSETDRIVLRSIVELVRSLGLQSIAEGIEDEASLASLRDLGCDLAQGFHIARPMPLADLRRWLAEARLSRPGASSVTARPALR
jgi:diguanylate cyclase (GGDEF)-like protein